jgi:hypothetical protein
MSFWHSKREQGSGASDVVCVEVDDATRETQPMENRGPHDRLLDQISYDLSAAVRDLHRVEMERLGRKVEAAHQFQQMLENLKGRIARRAVVRSAAVPTLSRMVIPSEAA